MKTEFKIIMIGPERAGKTTFINTHLGYLFTDAYAPTWGMDVHTINCIVNNVHYTLHIWDVAGQDRYKGMARGYYHDADGILVFYDPRDENCIDVKKDLEDVYQVTGDIPTVVVKTKGYDLGVETENVCEIDTKSGWNIDKPFDLILAKLLA